MSKIADMINSDPNQTLWGNCFSRILKTKVSHFDGRTWYGYLTAKEIVYIVECWKCKAKDEDHVLWARKCLSSGDGTSRNFYFEVSDPIRIKLIKPKKA